MQVNQRQEFYTAPGLDTPASPIGYAKILVDILREDGVNIDDVLRDSDLLETQLEDPHLHYSHRQKMAIVRNSIWFDKQGLALRYGLRIRPWCTHTSVYGFAIMSSATLGEAIETLVKFYAVTGALSVLESATGGEPGKLTMTEIFPLGDLRAFEMESTICSLVKVIDQLLQNGDWDRKIRFQHEPTCDIGLYENILGCCPQFACSSNELQFSAELLDTPLTTANPDIATSSIRHCETLLKNSSTVQHYSHRVRRAIMEIPSESWSLNSVAIKLSVSPRTLRRNLALDNSSFQNLLDEIRRELALVYLSNSTISIDEIAARVGFAEARNFRRAFKRWTGNPPTEYRCRGLENKQSVNAN